MSEVSGKGIEVIVPEEVDQAWLDRFNKQYAEYNYGDFTATVAAEDWLSQPPEPGGYGSAYHILEDEMGPNGWWQTISGKIYDVGYTNIPHYHDTGFANVLALFEASLQLPNDSSRSLAEGRFVLIRLDRLKTGISITRN
jgi:hypothetical protein